MTEPLDLEEGKRLRECARGARPGSLLDDPETLAVPFNLWLLRNADTLLEAAAERDRLREITRVAIEVIEEVIADYRTALLSPVAPEEDKTPEEDKK